MAAKKVKVRRKTEIVIERSRKAYKDGGGGSKLVGVLYVLHPGGDFQARFTDETPVHVLTEEDCIETAYQLLDLARSLRKDRRSRGLLGL